MKKILLLITLCILFIEGFSAPFKFLPHKITQPDGTVIECFLSGDEFFNWIHDKEGFSIIKGNDKFYYYAVKEKEKIKASIYRVNSVDPKNTVNLKKWTIISKDEYNKKRDFYNIPSKNEISNAPHTGQFNNIVIYIRFSGENEISTTRQTYDDNLNSGTSNSLKSYFTEVSYNQLTINSTHYPDCVSPTTTNASYEDSHTRSYFQPYDAITNPDGYPDEERTEREHQLLVDAVTWVNANFAIDASLNIDGDDDGNVDNVCFMIQGNSDGWAELLWAHRWSLYSKTVNINGKRVYDYTFQPENQVDVVVLCHEMFHALGAPDLYHYDESTLSPVSSWDLMESGSGHMGAYMKYKYAGQKWITEIPEITTVGTYTLNPLTSSTNNCYKIASPNSTSEFFIVEYRKRSGNFESNLPGDGLLVYRINSDFNGNASYDGVSVFDEVYIYRPNGTTTINGNASSAIFSENVGRTNINDITNPSSFLSDGSDGGLNIFNITSAETTISFEVKFGDVNDPTDFTASIVSSDHINLTWNLNADNDSIVLAYSLDGVFGTPEEATGYISGDFISGGGEVLYVGKNTLFNHQSLSTGQVYYYQIWSKNSDGIYSLGNSTDANIPCEGALLPLSEDFAEGVLPSCWQNKDNTSSGQVWKFDNPGSRIFNSTSYANGFAILDSDNYGEGGSQNADLISPLLDLSTYSSVNLKFEHYFREYSGSSAQLIYSIDAGQTWSSIQTWNSTEGLSETPAVFNRYISSEVAGESEVLIAWKYVGSFGYYWLIDDIEITGVSTGNPVAVTNNATGISINSATLNGTINASDNSITEIQFEYGTETGIYSNTINAIPSTASGSTNTNVAVEITNLTENTEYFYRIKCKNSAEVLTGEEKSFLTDARPTIIITSDEENYVNINTFQIQLTFSEPIASILEADINITNGSVAKISEISSMDYSLDIAPDSDGEVTIQIDENTVEDLKGNGNIASSVFAIIYDSSAPEIIISSSETLSTETNPIPVIFTFNEDVSDFDISDITVTNGTAINLTSSSAKLYNAEIIPLNEGNITVNVTANLVIDIAGNNNIASNEWTIDYSQVSGIEVLLTAGIKLYPNPTNGLFTIEYNNSIKTGNVNIFDYTGKLIYTKIINNDNLQRIDLTNEAKGVYIIQFIVDQKQLSTQLIIQ